MQFCDVQMFTALDRGPMEKRELLLSLPNRCFGINAAPVFDESRPVAINRIYIDSTKAGKGLESKSEASGR